jgi:hypothetical protein
LNLFALGAITLVLADALPRCACGDGDQGPYRPALNFAIARIDVDSLRVFPPRFEQPGVPRDTLRSAFSFPLFDADRSVQIQAGLPLNVEISNRSAQTMTGRWRDARVRIPDGRVMPAIPIELPEGDGETEDQLPDILPVPSGVTSTIALAPLKHLEAARRDGGIVQNHLEEYETRELARRAIDSIVGDRYEVTFTIESGGKSRRCRVELVITGYVLPPEVGER